jgi:4-diphosphocytidyl-2-C-methyl-D-erythritol kinase
MDLPEDNTLQGAYRGFCEETGADPGIRVTLKKRIPSGAGLGGGSSDAAALVRALERLCGFPPDPEKRARIAARVGSDVFFFLLAEGCAVVTGRGENVRPIKARKDLFFAPLFPEEAVSTGEAYRLLDESFAAGYAPCAPALRELEAMYYGPVEDWRFTNCFFGPVSARHPAIVRALEGLREAGADFAAMSGSGSAVFGVFVSSLKARWALQKLKRRNKCRLRKRESGKCRPRES